MGLDTVQSLHFLALQKRTRNIHSMLQYSEESHHKVDSLKAVVDGQSQPPHIVRDLLYRGGHQNQGSGTGGLDVIRREAWPFYRKTSGVRLLL